jgi:DNA repair protein RadA/Sms
MVKKAATKSRVKYVCSECGYESPAFLGRCPGCDSWGTLVETVTLSEASTQTLARSGGIAALPVGMQRPQPLSHISPEGFQRVPLAIGEVNRVLGGGLVPGSLVLVSGDPGIGKSTLLLQVAAQLGAEYGPVLYVSAEESPQQIKLRAERLGVAQENLYVVAETDIEVILAHAAALQPALVVVDSIQTVALETIASTAGSVTQVRECTSVLMRWAKTSHVPVLIVGHVTKEGTIAGPRVLEHIVDVVLYLEGDRFGQYRVLRGVKNRFGSTDEVGIFEMAGAGLLEVTNPSEAFLQERVTNAAGSTVAVTVEGTRPILVEVQALTSPTPYGTPRRTANGVDANRLLLLTAVLSRRVGLALGEQDIFVNVVGGLKIVEPAADLAICTTIASAFRSVRVDPTVVCIGEVGLSGELRSVRDLDRRLIEAATLGFTRAIVPAAIRRGRGRPPEGLEVVRAVTVREAIAAALNEET